MSTAELAEHGERAGRALSYAWVRLGAATGDWLGGSGAGAGIVEAAHTNATVPSANALASALPMPPPAPPSSPVTTGQGIVHHGTGAARRVARAAAAVTDLGAAESLNRRSLEAVSRGGAYLTDAERLNSAELARLRGGGQSAASLAPSSGSTAHAVGDGLESQLAPLADMGSGIAEGHHLGPAGGGKTASAARHLLGTGESGKVAAAPLPGGWLEAPGGLVDRLRGLARGAADTMGGFGKPAAPHHQLAGSSVVMRARPF